MSKGVLLKQTTSLLLNKYPKLKSMCCAKIYTITVEIELVCCCTLGVLITGSR